ncbi:hypothetical protein L484_000736 [Morus notabilis]|uniref:C2H2-type domain-containing protein n=1 Tax=Morus notabilis TaxID=981085 RepID=W9SMR6_9ROSA|nr:hypothetical protein L484_000736 [Morus notabilis]
MSDDESVSSSSSEDGDEAMHRYPCSLCDHVADTQEQLVNHRKRHHNKKKTNCSLCGMKFKEKAVFDAHDCLTFDTHA